MLSEEIECIQELIQIYRSCCQVSDRLKKIYKKGRRPNFPEFVSEYLTRKICNATKAVRGDLQFGKLKIEVKCIASKGPISFGPEENWNVIIFVTVSENIKDLVFYVHKISPENVLWKQLKVNKTETFAHQCLQKRRPRITFEQLANQLPLPEYVIETTIDNIFNGILPKIEID
jgi:hypothetical protein